MGSLAKMMRRVVDPHGSELTLKQHFSPDSDYIAASVPKVLWVELTSKCPFDCIFCSRKSRWGNGRHMDFEIYKSVIRELQSPDLIRLNYSGESIHYPQLLEAIELAASTGAATELVTAFSSIPQKLLKGIAESRLDRLSVSLHTMDANQYKAIYQFGSLGLLKQAIHEFLQLRRAKGTQSPRLDFCFVAMSDNLAQLSQVAAYAKEVEVQEIFIHPIIRRHPIPYDFSRELAGTKLADTFKANLRGVVHSVQAQHPEVTLTVLNSDVEPNPTLSHVPRYFGPTLPQNARIHTCDQNPWETAHILANGDVAVCEVHDAVSLGNLNQQTLREIWQGEKYRQFRKNYSAGLIPECRECPWKMAYLPSAWKSKVLAAEGMSPQLVRGWYAEEGGNILWSKKESLVVLKNVPGGNHVRLAGILPQAVKSRTNVLQVECNGVTLGSIRNDSVSFLCFDSSFDFSQPAADFLHLRLTTQHVYRPSALDMSNDTRDLGFAMSRVEALRH